MASVTTDRLLGVLTNAAVKAPVRVATTGNITLSGLLTIDGITLAANDRVLAKDQTNAVDNGIWVASTGAWTRSLDFDGVNDVTGGTVVFVFTGAINGGSLWRVTTADPIVPGTTAIGFGSVVIPAGATATDITITKNAATSLTIQDAATAQSKLTAGVQSGATGANITFTPASSGEYPLKIVNKTGGIELSVTNGANANRPTFAVSDGGASIPGPNGVFYGGFGASGGPGAGAQGITFNLIANQDSPLQDANCAIYRVYGRGNDAGADNGMECYTGRGTFAAHTAALTGDLLGKFDGIGHNGTVFNPNFQGRFAVHADQDMTTAHGGGFCVVQTNIKDTLDADFAQGWDSQGNSLFGRGWLSGGNNLPSAGALWLKDAATPPTASVAGAGALFSAGRVPMWRDGVGNKNLLMRSGAITPGHLAAWTSSGELNDFVYEEGSWTPTIGGITVAGTQTYSIQVGRYIRVGNLVWVSGRVTLTAKDAATSGNLTMFGLPFVSSNVAGNPSVLTMANITNLALSTGYTQLTALVTPNAATIAFQKAGDNVGVANLTESSFAFDTTVSVSGFYRIN